MDSLPQKENSWGQNSEASEKASLLGGCLWPRSEERVYYQWGQGDRGEEVERE